MRISLAAFVRNPMSALPAPHSLLARFFFVLVCVFSAAAAFASDKPDLARLYANSANNPDQPPVILIHGLMGSTLVDAQTGKEFWPGGITSLAFSDYRSLVQMSAEDREGEGLVPGELFTNIAGVDFYSALISSLEKVGRFERGTPGQPVGEQKRRYYVLVYDWRKDNVEAVRKLHALIEQIRVDYRDPTLRVDIIAHSNGGLIANYYLRYGPTDVLDAPAFTPWNGGYERVRRVVMLGTPTLGSVRSVERLLYGMRIGLRAIPVEVMASLATPFEALPHPDVKPIVDRNGKPLPIDLYDPAMWASRHWSVYSPEVIARVRATGATPEDGDAAVAKLQALFVKHLRRAKRFQLALTGPLPASEVEVAIFGGDCKMTAARGLLVEDGNGGRVVFRPNETGPGRIGEPGRKPTKSERLDYEALLADPGDGLVTRDSQVGRDAGIAAGTPADFHRLPVAQTFFLCESHETLTSNTYFQNNLLYFLLSR
jgi:pimeloyl-ACP methyl ester carboxylesterase